MTAFRFVRATSCITGYSFALGVRRAYIKNGSYGGICKLWFYFVRYYFYFNSYRLRICLTNGVVQDRGGPGRGLKCVHLAWTDFIIYKYVPFIQDLWPLLALEASIEFCYIYARSLLHESYGRRTYLIPLDHSFTHLNSRVYPARRTNS